jgi:uncharacterized protein (TIGR00251 family)
MCVNAGQHFLKAIQSMPDISEALVEDRQGVLITIEVAASARTEAFPAGYNEWRKAVGCRVSAPALDGKANKAVLHLIAEALRIPLSSLSIRSGSASTQKRVLVAGMNKEEILARLMAISGFLS